jgi:antirestriction protein ArdC
MEKEKNNTKFNLYQDITDKIIEALEKGVGPWIKPWNDSGVEFGLHRNGVSDHVYRGINVLLLNLVAFEKGYTDSRWVTFNDAKKLGGHIKKGEKHTKIVFWKFLDLKEKTEGEAIQPDERESRKVIPLLRFYRVFNVEQCSNLKLKDLPKPENTTVPKETHEQAENILAIPTIRNGGSKAAYYPSHDFIQMPPKEAFEGLDHYYVTGFHETVHWTGHESRLNRVFGKRFGDSAYAFEELVAEMGAAFLGGHVGLSFKEMRHPEYIQSWINKMREDNKAIFTACRFAQEATDYVMDKVEETERKTVQNTRNA